MIDCREAVRRMWAYLDDGLEPVRQEEFEAHLETCRRCCGELEFSRHLRALVANAERTPPLPPELRQRIEELVSPGEPGDRTLR